MSDIFYRAYGEIVDENPPIFNGNFDNYIEPNKCYIEYFEYRAVKRTPKGCWIVSNDDWFVDKKRWVSNTSRKRFAYPSKEEAKNSLMHRKIAHIKILESQLQLAKGTLKACEVSE